MCRTHHSASTHNSFPLAQALIQLLAEDDEALVLAAWGGLDALAATIPKEDAPSHVAAVKDAVLSAKEKVCGRVRFERPQFCKGLSLLLIHA